MKTFLALAMTVLHITTASATEITMWATAVSKQESTGRAIVFRFAKTFRDGFQRGSFPDRVILVWKYTSDKGMPVTTEREAMDRMEDLLEPLIEKSGQSVLAMVSTGDDSREWVFYSKSEEEFLSRLNQALAGQPRFPIEIHASPDPEWSTYTRFLEGLQE